MFFVRCLFGERHSLLWASAAGRIHLLRILTTRDGVDVFRRSARMDRVRIALVSIRHRIHVS
ncbi:unnamed protein product [Ectocarpus sp. 13 AM-2016]